MTIQIIVGLLVANALAHVISAYQLRTKNPSMVVPVASFVLINGLLAYLLYTDVSRAWRGALLFPMIGGLGLLRQLTKEGGATIDRIILVLDILIVGGVVYLKFING